MMLKPGSRLGEILSPLGAGGMGEVYRARDTRLTWRGVFSGSRNGVLAYQGGNTGLNSQLTRVDRSGKPIATVGPPADLITHRVSPDGQKVAVSVLDTSVLNYHLWLYDLARGKESRLTFGLHRSRNPVWAPDGKTLLYAVNANGPYNLFEKRTDSTGSEELVLKSPMNKYPSDWSSDGRYRTPAPITLITGWSPGP